MKETIELREVIEIVWRGKSIIAICTITCMLIAGIMSWLIMEEKYESKAVVQVANAVQDTGIMSNYVAAEFMPNIYVQRIQNKITMQKAFQDVGIKTAFNMKNLILTVDPDPTKNLVELKYTAKSAEEAQQHLQILMDATKQNMNESVQETLKDLEITYKNKSTALTEEIGVLVEQYNKIVRDNKLPDLLILQEVMNKGLIVNITDLPSMSLSNIDGELQNMLLQLQAQIQSKSDEYSKALADYQSVKTGLDSFKPDPFVRIIVEPTLEDNPVSPNELINLVAGLLLGLMLGTAMVFVRFYWKNSLVAK